MKTEHEEFVTGSPSISLIIPPLVLICGTVLSVFVFVQAWKKPPLRVQELSPVTVLGY